MGFASACLPSAAQPACVTPAAVKRAAAGGAAASFTTRLALLRMLRALHSRQHTLQLLPLLHCTPLAQHLISQHQTTSTRTQHVEPLCPHHAARPCQYRERIDCACASCSSFCPITRSPHCSASCSAFPALCICSSPREGLCRSGEAWAALGAEKLRYVTLRYSPLSALSIRLAISPKCHQSTRDSLLQH